MEWDGHQIDHVFVGILVIDQYKKESEAALIALSMVWQSISFKYTKWPLFEHKFYIMSH